MRISWTPGDLEALCSSGELLRQRFPGSHGAAKRVLAVLSGSQSVGHVRTFRLAQLFLLPPTTSEGGRLLVRHKEIDVTTALLDDNQQVLFRTDTSSADWINPVRHLQLLDIAENSRS